MIGARTRIPFGASALERALRVVCVGKPSSTALVLSVRSLLLLQVAWDLCSGDRFSLPPPFFAVLSAFLPPSCIIPFSSHVFLFDGVVAPQRFVDRLNFTLLAVFAWGTWALFFPLLYLFFLSSGVCVCVGWCGFAGKAEAFGAC